MSRQRQSGERPGLHLQRHHRPLSRRRRRTRRLSCSDRCCTRQPRPWCPWPQLPRHYHRLRTPQAYERESAELLAGEDEDWDAIEREHNRELFIRLCVQVIASLLTLGFVVSLLWTRYQQLQLQPKAPAEAKPEGEAREAKVEKADAKTKAKGKEGDEGKPDKEAKTETKAEAKKAEAKDSPSDAKAKVKRRTTKADD